MTISREQDLDCQSHGCKFARVKTGMRTNGRCTCVDKLIAEIADQRSTIEQQAKEIERLVHDYDNAHGIMVKKNQAQREALESCVELLKEEAVNQGPICEHDCNICICHLNDAICKAQAALQEES